MNLFYDVCLSCCILCYIKLCHHACIIIVVILVVILVVIIVVILVVILVVIRLVLVHSHHHHSFPLPLHLIPTFMCVECTITYTPVCSVHGRTLPPLIIDNKLSSLTQCNYLLVGLPLFILPCTSISIAILPT